jgi:ribonuclease T2
MIKRLLSVLLVIGLSVIGVLMQPASAHAFVQASGTFTASGSCPALLSIRQQTNPGGITTVPNTAYPLLGKNKEAATHYQIRIEGADPPARWVAVTCGTISDASQPSANQDYVLAASWQPGFCETKPDKPECASQTRDRFDATHMVIHGLWPQPRNHLYCNVPPNLEQIDKSGQWFDLPELDLSPTLRQALAMKMPGYQSGLHRHEWYKHGTCYSATPEEYYRETIALMDQLNASPVRTLLVQNLERNITDDQLKQVFDEAFSAGSKVLMSCSTVNREPLIQEFLINLRGDINDDTEIATLLAAAPEASRGCQLGQVDSVDEQPFEVSPVTVNRLEDGRLQILIDPEQIP